MQEMHLRRSVWSRPVGALVSALIAMLIALTGVSLTPVAASAADSDVVVIPDANLKAAINRVVANATGTTRAATQDVTVAEAKLVTQLGTSNFPGGVADLTGAEALTNLTSLIARATGNSYTDLTPLAGLTKLTTLTLPGGQFEDLEPLQGLTQLTSLALNRSLALADTPGASDIGPLAGLTKLTTLNLANNHVRSLTGLPVTPGMVTLSLSGNEIRDVTPLLTKSYDPVLLTTINLTNNKVTDAAALAPLGEDGAKLGAAASLGEGLILTNNRVRDFSAFADWLKPPMSDQVTGQSVYVGTYPGGGSTVVLKDADPSVVPSVDPAVGAYDAATGKLTLVDPATESVAVAPNWTVYFTNPPVDPGEETGPQIEVAGWPAAGADFTPLAGAPQIGQTLRVGDHGTAFSATPCDGFDYEWLRDGEEFDGVPTWAVDAVAAGRTADRIGGSGTSGDSAAGDVLGDYTVSAVDVGHQLSVRVTCQASGTSSTSVATDVVTAEEPEQPVVQDLGAPTLMQQATGETFRTYNFHPRSGVVGDPTNPTIPFYVGQLDAAGRLVDPASITVALDRVDNQAGYEATLTADDVTISGTGAERTLRVDPRVGPIMADIYLTVTGPSGKVTRTGLAYVASGATTPTSRVLLGSSDASTAIGVGDGYLLVADDEKRPIRLYDGETSSREVASFDLPDPGVGKREIDMESSARLGDSIWWLGSQGKDKDNKNQPGRQLVYETTLTGAGANARLSHTGTIFTHLKTDLVEWDQTHGNRFGFAEATNEGGPYVTSRAGFNIEGAEFSPDDSALYLGFRAPVSPATPGGQALIVPLTNVEDLTSGVDEKARFGEPILLDLGGGSIREIRKNAADEYLIVSGGFPPSGEPGDTTSIPQALWAWNGQPDTAPRKLTTDLPADLEPDHTDNAGAWEGIGQMPQRLTPGAQVRLIMDQGYVQLYGSQTENKDDTNDWTNKARTDVFTLAGAAGSIADISQPGDFGYQPVGVYGPAREVTLTNAGSNTLAVGAVSIESDDTVSADDFMISGNTCTGQSLALDETCTIRIRFGPARDDATSQARLVVASDVPGGTTSVDLTGTSALAELTTAVPTVSGEVKVGHTVTASTGTWTEGTSLGYQWLRDDVAISGATTASYALTPADAGAQLSVEVTGTKAGYATASTTSEPVTVATGTLGTAAAVISGTAKVGRTLAVGTGAWTPGTTLTYQWLRNGAPVPGATRAQYVATAADARALLSVVVTGARSGYATASETSSAVRVARGTLSAGTPRISGRAAVGKKLTARPGAWTPGTRLTYQWYAGARRLAGADAPTLALTKALQGKRISVRVTGTKAGYTTVVERSRATRPVRS